MTNKRYFIWWQNKQNLNVVMKICFRFEAYYSASGSEYNTFNARSFRYIHQQFFGIQVRHQGFNIWYPKLKSGIVRIRILRISNPKRSRLHTFLQIIIHSVITFLPSQQNSSFIFIRCLKRTAWRQMVNIYQTFFLSLFQKNFKKIWPTYFFY